MLISSKEYLAWEQENLWLLKAQKPLKPLEYVKVDIVIVAPDKRASDLSNKCESLMDLLVLAEYLKDDNWFVVSELNLKFGGVDKANPRAEIIIKSRPSE